MDDPRTNDVIDRLRRAADHLPIPGAPSPATAVRRGRSRRLRRRIGAVSIAIVVGAAVVIPIAALTNLAGSDHAATPPSLPRNGSVAYVEQDGSRSHLYLVDPEGGRRQQLTFGAVLDNWPSWSPDGTELAFSRMDLSDRSVRLAVLDVGTGDVTYLTEASMSPARSDWSPDGNSIVFSRIQGGIYTVDVDGSRPKRIAGDGMVGPGGPHWSPDGTQIAFAGNPYSNINNWDIYVVDPDGANLRDITPTQDFGESEQLIDWSSEGDSLLVSIGPDGRAQRWVELSLDGHQISDIYDPQVSDQSPSLAPDGRSIIFWRTGSDPDGNFAVEISSGSASRVVDGGLLPAWQPILDADTGTSAVVSGEVILEPGTAGWAISCSGDGVWTS